jgi:hypothetical protein
MLLPNSIWDDAKDWFDYWLKGEDNGIMDEPPVSIYQSWTRSEKSFSDYPIPEAPIWSCYPANGMLKGQLNKTKAQRANPPPWKRPVLIIDFGCTHTIAAGRIVPGGQCSRPYSFECASGRRSCLF